MDILEVWKMVYFRINQYRGYDKLCCESIKSDKSAHKVSCIVIVHYLRFFQNIFGEGCSITKIQSDIS